MKQLRKIVLIALAFCMLTACKELDKTENTQFLANKEPVEVSFSWWGNDDRHIYTMAAISNFENTNEDIRVKYKYGEWNGYPKRMEVAMASHTEADLMQINYNWISKYSSGGDGFYDLYELKDYINLDNYDRDILAYGEVNGKLNGIPTALNTMVFYQNKSMYEQYGLEVPTTWDEYFEAAKVMQKDGIYPLGMVQKQMFLLLISRYEQQTGKEFITRTGDLFATKENIEGMLEYNKLLIDEKVVMLVDKFEREEFANRKVAGSIAWVSDGENYCGDLIEKGCNIIVGEYPVLDNAKRLGWYVKPATLYAIRKDTQCPKEAARLLNYMVSDEYAATEQGLEKGIPLNKSAYKTLEEAEVLTGIQYDADAKMHEYRREMNLMSPYTEELGIIEIYKKYSEAYLYNQISKEDAANAIYNEMKAQLKILKSN